MFDTAILCFTILYAITMIVALVGNTLLIYIVWKKPATRSLTSFLFVNMAVADLLTVTFLMPANLAHLHGTELTAAVGQFHCRFNYFATFVSATASIFCLAIMAVDRYFAVVHPFRQIIWFRKAKIITPVIWISSMALMSVVPFAFHPKHGMCWFDYSVIPQLPFWIYILLLTYILPLGVIAILYSIAARKIWFHEVPLDHQASQRNQRDQEIPKKKIIRMLVIIVVVFAVCWLPVHVYQIDNALGNPYWPIVPYLFCYWFSQANSAINPWLYISLNGKMSAVFKRMVRCCSDKGIQQGTRGTASTKSKTKASSSQGTLMETRL